MAKQHGGHIDDPELFGTRLKEAREAAGVTQSAISEPFCAIGYVSRIEHGMRVPSLQLVRWWAQKLGVSEAWLARGVEEPASTVAIRKALTSSVTRRVDSVVSLDLGCSEQEMVSVVMPVEVYDEALASLSRLEVGSEHIFELDADGFSWAIEHPLECRQRGLTHCPVHRAVSKLYPFSLEPGRWRVRLDDDLFFEVIK